MTYDRALEIAARVWRDQDMEYEVLDCKLCDLIAQLLYDAYKEGGE